MSRIQRLRLFCNQISLDALAIPLTISSLMVCYHSACSYELPLSSIAEFPLQVILLAWCCSSWYHVIFATSSSQHSILRFLFVKQQTHVTFAVHNSSHQQVMFHLPKDRWSGGLALAQVYDTLFVAIFELFASRHWYFSRHFGSCFVIYLVFADWTITQQIELVLAHENLPPRFEIGFVSDSVFSFTYFITVVVGSAL